MKAFITGSRAYGTPRDGSDVDLVVLVTHAEAAVLKANANANADSEDDPRRGHDSDTPDFDPSSIPLRFSGLNLLVFTSPVAFALWHECTAALKRRARDGFPVTRDQAIAYFRAARDLRKITTQLPDPNAVLGKPTRCQIALDEEE